MKERPIIFSGESVRAILDGRKTQTRRVVAHQPSGGWAKPPIEIINGRWASGGAVSDLRCPFAPGMRLWAKEKWKSLGSYPDNGQAAIEYAAGGRAHYTTSDWGKYMMLDTNWRSPLFMPRWAARLVLEITRIGVQRVHQISDADVIAEGINPILVEKNREFFHKDDCHALAFAASWEKINGKNHPWSSNPWVWAIEFKLASPP